MSFMGLQRNASQVMKCLRELDDKRVVCTETIKIYIPSRFVEIGLASIGTKTQILGMMALVLEGKAYSVMQVMALVGIDPTNVTTIIIDEIEYYEFEFEPGSTVFTSLDIVQNDALAYLMYNEIIAGGRVPAYFSYIDLGHLFDTARSYAGANIGRNREVTELIVSLIARNEHKREMYYRQTITQLSDVTLHPPAFIPLRSVQYSATNTTNRLVGSYFREGLTAALVSPAERQERIEKLLTA